MESESTEHIAENSSTVTASNENLDQENGSGLAYHCCYPSGKAHRFIALIFMCFLGFGK